MALTLISLIKTMAPTHNSDLILDIELSTRILFHVQAKLLLPSTIDNIWSGINPSLKRLRHQSSDPVDDFSKRNDRYSCEESQSSSNG